MKKLKQLFKNIKYLMNNDLSSTTITVKVSDIKFAIERKITNHGI
jgi:hypothetical protein